MNRDEFYGMMARHDDAGLRKALWTVYWRGNAQLRERVEDALRPQELPKVKQKEVPEPAFVLSEVTEFVELATSGAYMAGDRRVHRTERSRWRHTFRDLASQAVASLADGEDQETAQQAVVKMVDLACQMKDRDYFHSEDPIEAAKFVVSDAVAALWDSMLRHDGFAKFAERVPAQLIRWEQRYGWTRRGGRVPDRETPLAEVLGRLLSTPDMWATFAGSYLTALDRAGSAGPGGSRRPSYQRYDPDGYRRQQRAKNLQAWHEMLISRFAGTPEDRLLDRLAASPGIGGAELAFLRALIAEGRGDLTEAGKQAANCLEDLPGHHECLALAQRVGADLPPRARQIADERAKRSSSLATLQREQGIAEVGDIDELRGRTEDTDDFGPFLDAIRSARQGDL